MPGTFKHHLLVTKPIKTDTKLSSTLQHSSSLVCNSSVNLFLNLLMIVYTVAIMNLYKSVCTICFVLILKADANWAKVVDPRG